MEVGRPLSWLCAVRWQYAVAPAGEARYGAAGSSRLLQARKDVGWSKELRNRHRRGAWGGAL
jgi:hypothetical protein